MKCWFVGICHKMNFCFHAINDTSSIRYQLCIMRSFYMVIYLPWPIVKKWCHMLWFILVNMGSANGLSPLQHQATTWTDEETLSVGTIGTNDFHSTRYIWKYRLQIALQWRHNGHDSISNHQPHNCLLNRLFRRRSKKTSKLCVTGLCAGNSPVNSPHKGPVTRKMIPFDDVIMVAHFLLRSLFFAVFRWGFS